MTVVEFLEARLAEDESERTLPAHDWQARALREAAAKRAIITDHWLEEFTRPNGSVYHHCCARCIESTHWLDTAGGGEMVAYPCPTLRALVAVYADHPDFDQAWSL